jgi:hypothetical protein
MEFIEPSLTEPSRGPGLPGTKPIRAGVSKPTKPKGNYQVSKRNNLPNGNRNERRNNKRRGENRKMSKKEDEEGRESLEERKEDGKWRITRKRNGKREGHVRRKEEGK